MGPSFVTGTLDVFSAAAFYSILAGCFLLYGYRKKTKKQ
jgi:hypothetical protein